MKKQEDDLEEEEEEEEEETREFDDHTGEYAGVEPEGPEETAELTSVATAGVSDSTLAAPPTRVLSTALINAAREAARHLAMMCAFHAQALIAQGKSDDAVRKVAEAGLGIVVKVDFTFGEACLRKLLGFILWRAHVRAQKTEDCRRLRVHASRQVARSERLFRKLRVWEGMGACLVLRGLFLEKFDSLAGAPVD